jgi:MFS family permease
VLKAVYPAVWGCLQVFTGPLSDRWGRKGLIVAGMWTQAAGIFVTVATRDFGWWLLGSVLLGPRDGDGLPRADSGRLGRLASLLEGALPERLPLLAGPRVRVGALSAGIVADVFGISWAIGSVGVLTFLSGAVVAALMREGKQAKPANERG